MISELCLCDNLFVLRTITYILNAGLADSGAHHVDRISSV
ncbi:hypothetical protein SOV_11260 [Sporomusa ovata DSM 2662]|nr:hypothetical protein SOV_1c04640 [Sporomusa ovata DSM 2662]